MKYKYIPKKLKKKNKKKEQTLEERRNLARLTYPVDIRIDLAVIKTKGKNGN
jgi:hypothetical protein